MVPTTAGPVGPSFVIQYATQRLAVCSVAIVCLAALLTRKLELVTSVCQFLGN
jgi:small neutral amino acid transporter SnatA (MarC family)